MLRQICRPRALALSKPLCRFYARPADVRFIQAKQDQSAAMRDAVMARYRAKLEKKAKAEGLSDAEELEKKMMDKIIERRKKFSKVDPLKELEDYQKAEKLKDAIDSKKGAKKDLGTIDANSPEKPFKTLDSFVKVDKLKNLTAEQIEMVWRARFQMKDRSLCATVPASTFDRMYVNARKYPRFVLPVPHNDAQVGESKTENADEESTPVEMHFVQWSFVGPNTTHVMITSLAEYQAHQEYSRPHTTIAFHSELSKPLDIVLMNGHVDSDAAVSMHDAQLLLMNLQRFYGGLGTETPASEERLELVKQFNEGSPDFDVKKLIASAESMEN